MSEPTLDDLFNDEEVEEAEAVAEVTEAEPETAEKEVTEEPEAKAEEPEAEATAAPEKTEDESWTKAAVLDERRKRQALEAELQQLRSAPQKEVEVPDVIDDQKGYTDYVNSQIQQGVSNAKIAMSQAFMRLQDPEYDQKEAEFMELTKENPKFAQEVLAHEMPAKYVVDMVNKHREYKQMQDIDGYKAKLKAEVEAEVRAKLEAEMAETSSKNAEASSIKPSLATARASKGQNAPTYETVEDLFG